MDLSLIVDPAIAAAFVSCFGGLTRILLGVDKDLTLKKQVVLVFISALPAGWGVYFSMVHHDYPYAAFPAALFMGTTALSFGKLLATDGSAMLKEVFLIFIMYLKNKLSPKEKQ